MPAADILQVPPAAPRGATGPAWAEEYRRRVVSAAEAVRLVKSGDRVYIHPGAATPEDLARALVARASELRNVEIVHLLTLGYADYVKPGMEESFRHLALFVGPNVREAVNAGRADYMPVFLSEVPELFSSGRIPLDVVLIQVSPPDEHGFCSLGVGVETTKTAAKYAKRIVAEVNPRMPRTLGDCFLHVTKLDAVVEVDRPLFELKPSVPVVVQTRVGEHVASLIEDGSTLQMGIGGIPDAVLSFLGTKQDLGIHTEMFSDGVMELIQAGVINNERKTLHPGKVVASFLMGTRTLYEFVHNNPIIEMHPTEYVNDPFVIAKNDRMVAINSALQVDLSGQVCADSMGFDIFSGFGGQVDFVRGAARSRGGKPIIALPSTAKDATLSRIVPALDTGAGVVTTRADVHYVVTEYGIAELYGRNLRQRAEALIDVAHPDFREELRAFARGRRLIG
jgi:4-hydroxybutyrate CoA-transferase